MSHAPSEFLVQHHPPIVKPVLEMFISDVHFPDHDPQAWDLTIRVAEYLQPDILFHGGDIFDFYQFSKFAQDPKRHTTAFKEIEEAALQLDRLWSRVPKAELLYRSGNHEELRWEKWLWKNAPQLVDFPQLALQNILGLDPKIITVIPTTHLYKVGELYHAHGDEFTASQANPARDIFRSLQGCVIFGHWHTLSLYYHRVRAKNRQYGAFGNGCLCNLNPEYTRFPQWQQGISIIHYVPEGLFHVDQIPYFRTKKGKLGCILDGQLFTV